MTHVDFDAAFAIPQCLPYMPQIELASSAIERDIKARNLTNGWCMCSNHHE